MTGEGIPFRKLGFDSLGSFFDSLPDTLVVRRLPTGGMMVGPLQPGQQVRSQPQRVIPSLIAIHRFQTSRNLRSTRNVSSPVKPVRRPKEQSTAWCPPSKNNKSLKQYPKSKITVNENRKALRQPRQLRNVTEEEKKETGSTAATKQEKISNKKLLREYFAQKNLGEVTFKIAVMGNKGREKYLATITVEGAQYKTYPDSFQTKEEAEEAVSELAIKKLGLNGGGGGIRGGGESAGKLETIGLMQDYVRFG